MDTAIYMGETKQHNTTQSTTRTPAPPLRGSFGTLLTWIEMYRRRMLSNGALVSTRSTKAGSTRRARLDEGQDYLLLVNSRDLPRCKQTRRPDETEHSQ